MNAQVRLRSGFIEAGCYSLSRIMYFRRWKYDVCYTQRSYRVSFLMLLERKLENSFRWLRRGWLEGSEEITRR